MATIISPAHLQSEEKKSANFQFNPLLLVKVITQIIYTLFGMETQTYERTSTKQYAFHSLRSEGA